MFDVSNAFWLGIAYGLGPCTISCAPLIVPFIMSAANGKKEGIIYSIIFSIGRVISYMTLGFFSGLIGKEINMFIPSWGIGLLFVTVGLLVLFKVQGKCILKTKFKITGNLMALVIGIIYGFGPCPPLVALLGLAVASKSQITGALMGLVFGIGTILSPIIVLGLLSGWFSRQKEFKQIIPNVSGVFLIIIGIFYFF